MLKLIFVLMIIVYIISCLFLIVVILFQEGKGGGLSGLAGASALGDTFGASAAESTLRRWTRNTAILFIVLSISITLVGAKVVKKASLVDQATSGSTATAQDTREIEPTTGTEPLPPDFPTTAVRTPAPLTTGTAELTTAVTIRIPRTTGTVSVPAEPGLDAAPTTGTN